MDMSDIIGVFDNYRGLPVYTEAPQVGAAHRAEYLASVEALIEEWRGEGARKRLAFMPPDEFGRDPERFRALFVELLGRPLSEIDKYRSIAPVPPARESFVAQDGQAKISRVTLEVMPGFAFYGILFRPLDLKAGERRRLVISQHGGGGTPESCSDFYGKNNYNRMTRRHLERGSVVFAPQLLLWAKEWGAPGERGMLDAHMKQFGGSITALEVFCHMRAIDWLVTLPEVDARRIGMNGLSYGGFFSLVTPAADTRIKSAYSCAFFNGQVGTKRYDHIWFNSGNSFLDAEIAALIAPRSLYIENGRDDPVFDARLAEREAERVPMYYAALGASEKLRFKIWEGGHSVDVSDDGMDFFYSALDE